MKHFISSLLYFRVWFVLGGDTISWHYIGTLSDGTGFDSGNFHATIDKGQVITGVNEAMKGLCVGGECLVFIVIPYQW